MTPFRARLCLISVLIATFFPAGPAEGAAGHLETGFDAQVSGTFDNFTGHVHAIGLQPDGKIVIGGLFDSVGGMTRENIARLNADGTLDTAFNASALGPPLRTDNRVNCVVIQPDGRIIIAGAFKTVNGEAHTNIARLEADGTLDTSFTASTSDPVYAMALQPDGGILIGGAFFSVNGTSHGPMARLTASGALDQDFSPGLGMTVLAITRQRDGKILYGGTAGMGRLNTSGSFDSGFDPIITGQVMSIVAEPDGQIAVAGDMLFPPGVNKVYMARLSSTGARDNTFNPNTTGQVWGMALQADGKYVIGGGFTKVGTVSHRYLARLTQFGSLDTAFSVPSISNGVEAVALQEDGAVLIGGPFLTVDFQPRTRLARLQNDAATETLIVPKATEVRWTRGGASPETMEVTFDVSINDGVDWTSLGTPSFSSRWYKTGLSLPATGKLRARAVLSGGQNNASGGIVETIQSFVRPPAPEIAIAYDGNDLANGAEINAGITAVGTTRLFTFTISNSGDGDLHRMGGVTVPGTGTSVDEFFMETDMTSPVVPAGSTTFVIRFSPKTAGAKANTFYVYTDDDNESGFTITLQSSAVLAVPPTVKTLAATGVNHEEAILQGQVDAKGSARDIFFDYGNSAALGTTVAATPDMMNGFGAATATAALSGLNPHTKYHYRVRAAGTLGAASGTIMTFATDNHVPSADADPFTLLPGATIPLDVLTNDDDADSDAVTLGTNTALVPAAAGKLVKSGNGFVFTAAATFNGAAFTYTAKDAFGGVSTAATVTLTKGPGALDPTAVALPSAGTSYPVTVTTAFAWVVTENLPWVSVTPASGTGDGTVTVTLQPNTATAARTGTVTIAGQAHAITQAGVLKPALTPPAMIPPAIVAGAYELTIPTTNFPVTYTVTNMPPGLTINGNTGLIGGLPTKAGNYPVTIKARNAAGAADAVLSFSIIVAELKVGMVGTFHGLVDPHPTLNTNLGSRLEIVTTSTGAYTGKLITGATNFALKGVLSTDPDLPNEAHCSIPIPRKNDTTLSLDLDFSHDAHSILGTLNDGGVLETDVRAWRNVWSAKTGGERATDYMGSYSFSLEQPTPGATLPQGYGYGTLKVTSETTGALTVGGKLADGSAFATTSFIGPNGQFFVYQSLYGNRGSLAGVLTINLVIPATENNVRYELQWFKPGPLAGSKETLYKDGFGPLPLTVEGGPLLFLPAGGVVLNLPNADNKAQLVFANGGLEIGGNNFDLIFSIRNPSLTGKTNKVTIPANLHQVTLATLNLTTGAIAGTFNTAAVSRVPYQGQIVRHLDGSLCAYGYFILPAATGISKSGSVILREAK